jgi:hypothetical protein
MSIMQENWISTNYTQAVQFIIISIKDDSRRKSWFLRLILANGSVLYNFSALGQVVMMIWCLESLTKWRTNEEQEGLCDFQPLGESNESFWCFDAHGYVMADFLGLG